MQTVVEKIEGLWIVTSYNSCNEQTNWMSFKGFFAEFRAMRYARRLHKENAKKPFISG